MTTTDKYEIIIEGFIHYIVSEYREYNEDYQITKDIYASGYSTAMFNAYMELESLLTETEQENNMNKKIVVCSICSEPYTAKNEGVGERLVCPECQSIARKKSGWKQSIINK